MIIFGFFHENPHFKNHNCLWLFWFLNFSWKLWWIKFNSHKVWLHVQAWRINCFVRFFHNFVEKKLRRRSEICAIHGGSCGQIRWGEEGDVSLSLLFSLSSSSSLSDGKYVQSRADKPHVGKSGEKMDDSTIPMNGNPQTEIYLNLRSPPVGSSR